MSKLWHLLRPASFIFSTEWEGSSGSHRMVWISLALFLHMSRHSLCSFGVKTQGCTNDRNTVWKARSAMPGGLLTLYPLVQSWLPPGHWCPSLHYQRLAGDPAQDRHVMPSAWSSICSTVLSGLFTGSRLNGVCAIQQQSHAPSSTLFNKLTE